jgi:hypothetical protein
MEVAMEGHSTLADKLLESLARQRDEGLLTDEEFASRAEQLVRVPAPEVIQPLPDAEFASPWGLAESAAQEGGEDGDSTLDPVVSDPPQIQTELDSQAPADTVEPIDSPQESQQLPDADTRPGEAQERQVGSAETEVARQAVVADPVRAPEGSGVTGDGAAEGQNPQAPHSRRRRFSRKAKAPAADEVQVPAPPAGVPAPGGMSEERLAELKDKLREFEMEGWQAVSEYRGCGFYSNRLTDDGLLVLPDGSVLDKWEAAVSALNGDETWASYHFEDERIVLLSPGCASLTYTASAQMLGEPEYRAVVTSVYVRRGDDWLIALRQETPVHPMDNPS